MDYLLPNVVNAITAVLNSPTALPLFECTGWRYERIFALTATQPAQMLATFGLLFVPCYWSDCLGANPEFLCGGTYTCIVDVGYGAMRARRQLQVHQEG